MIASLAMRLAALERNVGGNGRPVAWVRCEFSNENDPPELKREREERARAAFIATHGDPGGDICVIHHIIVAPKRSAEAASNTRRLATLKRTRQAR